MSGTTTIGGISIPITANDTATPVINRVNKMIAGMTVPTRRLGQTTSAAFNANPVERMTLSMRGLGRASFDVFRNLDRTVPLLGIMSSGGVIAGVTALEKHYADLGQSIGNTATRLGISTDRLSSWQGAARLGGASVEDMTSGLTSLDERLRGATFRGDSQAIQAFRILGVNFGQIGVKARSADDAMGDLADGLKRVNDTQGRGAAYRLAQVLGLEALFPQLVKGKGAIEAWRKDAEGLGYVLSPAMVARAEALHNAFSRVGEAVEGAANRIADNLAPVMTPLLNSLADWISDNGKLVAQDVGGWISRTANELKKMDWSPVKNDAKDFLGFVEGIAKTSFDGVVAGIGVIDDALDKLRGRKPEDKKLTIPERIDRSLETVKWLIHDLPGQLGTTLREWFSPGGMLDFGGITGGGSDQPTEFSLAGIPNFMERFMRPSPLFGPGGQYLNQGFGGGSHGIGGPIRMPQGPTNAAAVMQQTHDFFINKGLSEEVVAGIQSNVAAESGFDPSIVNKTSGAYGLFQDLGDRLTKLHATYGAAPSVTDQLNNAWNELQTTHRGVLTQLTRPGVGHREAAKIFSSGFEIPLPENRIAEENRRADGSDQFMQGHVKVDVTLGGAVPPGTTASGRSTGIAVMAAPPRVGMALPLFGQ